MTGVLPGLVTGAVSGILSGAFGIGGGLATTPALRVILGQPALIAVGTPLPVIVPTACAGAIYYSRRGMAEVRAGLVVGATGCVAAVAGAWLSHLVGGSFVMIVTAGIIALAAVDQFHQSGRRLPSTAGGANPPKANATGLAALGVATGLYSGFLGLGGGFVIIPALTRFFGFPIKKAFGTSLVAVALLAIPGSVAHYLLGHVNVSLAITLAAGSIPGALLGARLTSVTAERHTRIAFASLLVVAALTLVGTEMGLFGA